MANWYQDKRTARFRPWKPEVCEVPGCSVRHPQFSLDGTKGPWRCAEHNAAERQRRRTAPAPQPEERSRCTPAADAPPDQKRLL